MSTPPLNPLVDKIRTAHPGAYDDMDDAALTKAVLAKYPQYSDLAAPKPQEPVKPEAEPESDSEGMLAGISEKVSKLWDHLTGAGKDVANQIYDVSTPAIATEIWKHLHGQPNNLDKIPGKAVLAFLTAGGLPEGEAGEAGEAAKAPEPNQVRGEVHNAIAETAAKEEPKLAEDDPNQVSKEEWDEGHTNPHDPDTRTMEEKQKSVDDYYEAHPEKKPVQKIVKRGPNKGQPATYRVFDGKTWRTVPKMTNPPQ